MYCYIDAAPAIAVREPLVKLSMQQKQVGNVQLHWCCGEDCFLVKSAGGHVLRAASSPGRNRPNVNILLFREVLRCFTKDYKVLVYNENTLRYICAKLEEKLEVFEKEIENLKCNSF